MRNKAGFMALTLLMLTVPALANAWTLAVRVAGGTDANNVTVAYSVKTGTQGVDETTKTYTNSFKSSSSFMYPVGVVTVTPVAGFSALTFDGVDCSSPTALTAKLATATSGSHTLAVAYATTATASGLTITQAPLGGGMIYAENRNNTWSTTSVSGLVAGASVPVTIAADVNHNIVSYSLDGGAPIKVGVTGAAGQALTLSALANNQAVTATFGVVANTTVSLFAPTAAATSNASWTTPATNQIVLSATTTSNDTNPLYLFSVTGPAPSTAVAFKSGTLPSVASTFSFSPTVAGTYTATVSVTSDNSTAATTATASANIVVAAYQATVNQSCESCHSTQSPTIVSNYNASVHNLSAESSCEGCHTTKTPHSANVNAVNVNKASFVVISSAANGIAKGNVYCTLCHAGGYAPPHLLGKNDPSMGVTCAQCHTATSASAAGTGDAHAIQQTTVVVDGATGCINCHSVGQKALAGKVNDNNGVRAITGEFTKWSHHVSGTTVQDAHCAACHLEGKAVNGIVVVDASFHMKDAQTHLRNAHDDSDMQWNPAAPNHTTMDNFCMSCHSATGATSPGSLAVQAVIVPVTGKTASALNPFGDTISNRYDKMQRPAVTNVDNQFDTTNNSHHAVKGPRYSGRTRVAGPRQIASPTTFANNSSALLQGKRSTLFDAGNLNNLYTPLANAGGEVAPRTGSADLGDDSTLHCGDCHTVGQWKVGSSETRLGQPTPDAIGAHGSNNEYMLRNTLGTDARHTQNAYTLSASNAVTWNNPNGAFLVCYNCHTYTKYGSIYVSSGLDTGSPSPGPHAGEYDVQGRCNGIGNTLPFNGYTTGTATDGSQFASRFMGPISKYSKATTYAEQDPDFGNIFGIQCANCHNSGMGNAYGGIHGSANNTNTTTATVAAGVTGGAYIDGMGNTTKVERFLPGLGNAMYVPGTLGGFTGGTTVNGKITGGVSIDTNWEQKSGSQVSGMIINDVTGILSGTAGVSAGAGCYTLGAATAATDKLRGPSVTGQGGAITTVLDTWGGCEDHGGAQGSGTSQFKRIVRPVTY